MSLTEAASRALRIATVGVSLGALAAAPALFGLGAADVGRVAGWLAWGLAVVPSLVLLVLAINDRQEGNTAPYTGGARSYALHVAIGISGAAIAYAAFFTLASTAPILLGNLDAAAVRRAVEASTGGTMPGLALAGAALGSLAVTAWVDRGAGD